MPIGNFVRIKCLEDIPLKKMKADRKKDFLTLGLVIVVGIVITLGAKFAGIWTDWLKLPVFLSIYLAALFPSVLRQRKMRQKIAALCKVLPVSIEEVRAMGKLGRYDLLDWNWSKAFISVEQLYLLEEALEEKYVATFGTPFVLEK